MDEIDPFPSAARSGPPSAARGFWFHRPEDSFPPPAVRAPGEYNGGPNLNLSGDTRGLTAKARKARLAAWCEVLPTLRDVRMLWLHDRVPQALFDAACAMPGLEGLYIKASDIVDASAVERAPALRYLRLGASPKLAGVEPIGRCVALRWLELENVHSLVDLEPLAGLGELEGFGLSGDERRGHTVASFAPLAAWTRLRWLYLATVHAADGSLRPLAGLAQLRWLGIGCHFAWEEFARLAGRLPEAECTWFAAGTPGFVPCPRCGARRWMPTGKGLRDACPRCDAARWEAHRARFEVLRDTERAFAAVDRQP